MISIPTHALDDGTTLPALGLGTWPLGDDEAQQAVLSALEAGYRLKETGMLPSVDQIELHPFLPQDDLRACHAGKSVLTERWSPLGRGTTLLQDPAVARIA